MRMDDMQCVRCEKQFIDVLTRDLGDTEFTCAHCGGKCVKVFIGKPPSVIGDECDITVKHGLCNPDGSPRRYRSKAEMAAEGRRRNLTNAVDHIGAPGSDKNRNTQRWV